MLQTPSESTNGEILPLTQAGSSHLTDKIQQCQTLQNVTYILVYQKFFLLHLLSQDCFNNMKLLIISSNDMNLVHLFSNN